MDYETGKWLEQLDLKLTYIHDILVDKAIIPKPKENGRKKNASN